MSAVEAALAGDRSPIPAKGRTVGQRIGYTSVSTVAQTLDQQNAALAKAEVSKTFSDNMSGARDDRPGLLSRWRMSGKATPWWCGSWS